MALRISRTLALLTGIVLPAIETWRRWDALSNWPAWLDDYLASGLLLFAWWAGRTEVRKSRPYLMAAWGYTLGMAYPSFFGQLASTNASDPSGLALTVVLGFKAFGLVLAAGCLALAWRSD